MSAHLTSNKSISKLAAELLYRKGQGKIEEDIGKDAREIAKNLYDLNVFSLQERYQDPSELIGEFEYQKNIRFKTDEQYFMSLQHFTYQACEGRAEEKELYKVLEEEEKRMAYKLARQKAKEKGAEWK